MWHVSIARHDRRTGRATRTITAEHLERARRALHGVGDLEHEWTEHGATAIHVRRRLTAAEWNPTERPTPWGTDLRHIDTGRARLAAAGITAATDPASEW